MESTTPITKPGAKRHVELTQSIVRELIHYSAEKGTFTWKHRGKHWFSDSVSWKKWNSKHEGREAGYVHTQDNGCKRRVIAMLGKQYKAYRIAFLYMTGSMPWHVDHRDRNSLNDRWENLRASDPVRNQRNKSLHRSNTSGVSGVNWHKPTGRWKAEVSLNGKSRYLGLFNKDDIDIAAMAVMEFRADHGFDPSHGLEHAHYYRSQNHER